MKLPWGGHKERGNGKAPGPAAYTPPSEDRDLAHLRPGDVISIWGDEDHVVTCVFDCAEGIGARRYTWTWSFLDDGSLIEHSADGQWHYSEHQIVPQGSALYSDLVGPGGLLEQFEARVRNDTVADDPVFVMLKERRYRVTSTGVVEATRRGDPPGLAPWTQLVSNPEENAYFSLVAADDETQGVLGLWTSHVCLSYGRPFEQSDITAIYRRGP
jgi:hypothetical protein